MAQKHFIGKQILDIEVNTSQNSYEMQQEMSKWVQERLNPEIEKLFDSLVNEQTILKLDNVEVNLGEISFDAKNRDTVIHEIITSLKIDIEKQLKTNYVEKKEVQKRPLSRKEMQRFFEERKAKQKREEEQTDFKSKTSTERQGSNPKEKEETVQILKNNSQSLRRHYFDMWLFWLQNGKLPSYSSTPNANWVDFILETLALDNDAVHILARQLKRSSISLKRLVLQHSVKELKSIVELYTGYNQSLLIDVFQEFEKLVINTDFKNKTKNSNSTTYRILEVALWQEVLSLVMLQKEKKESIALFSQAIEKQVQNGITHNQLLSIFAQFEFNKAIAKTTFPLVQKVIENTKISKPEYQQTLQIQIQEAVKDKKQIEKEGSDADIIESKAEKTTKNSKKETLDTETAKNSVLNQDKEELQSAQENERAQEINVPEKGNTDLEVPVYFSNSGVVLLHPFITSFFNKLGLIENKDFKDQKARSRAVYLLHYLATGEENPREFEMVLPKFLCEMPVNFPLDRNISITANEKEEATNLLKAAVAHWGALGGSSADALREGFLRREGKLEKEQSGWRLIVERKTIDILLNKLPWNVNIVKLPWMQEIMYVEWN